MTDNTPHNVNLPYRIAKCTGYSGKYAPEHILVNAPTDQTSRWSGAHQTESSKQWLILELLEPSLLRSITFGKYHKAHPCNMKEFKIYTGRTLDTLSIALHGGLNNDNVPETFNLQRRNAKGLLSPVRFIKIVPLSAHTASFHTSIWHVSFSGENDPSVVQRAEAAYASYRETSVLLHVMKYLRQRRHLSALNALQSRTGMMLEHPIVTRIYNSLMSSDWSLVESLIQQAADDGLFDNYIDACDPKALWHRLNGANADGDVPSSRGGHQMCIDSEAGMIYLFGGWDGERNLDDLWSYSISQGRWRMMNSNATTNVTPGPRSCHKMVLDPLTGYIYLLGRFDGYSPSDTTSFATHNDQFQSTAAISSADLGPTSSQPPAGSSTNGTQTLRRRAPSDFYRFATRGLEAGTWTKLSEDTGIEEGPPLVHDHQMAVDAEKQMLYVFGGRVIQSDPDAVTIKFSGLYQYSILTGKWTHLMDESSAPTKQSRNIPARFGHSMVFDPRRRRLIILGGKRVDTFLSDMYYYEVDTGEVTEVATDFSGTGGPDACFFHRTVLDTDSGHIYVLPGLLKPKGQKDSPSEGVALRSKLWVYRPESSQWSSVTNTRLQEDSRTSSTEAEIEPPPRYAHQMVYDNIRKTIYVHGGNSGRDDRRLDDFWSMKFELPTRDETIRKAKFILRRQRFKELCENTAPVQALMYLQRDVHAVVDHQSDEEAATFRSLHSHLFASRPSSPTKYTSSEDVEMSDVSNAETDGTNATSEPFGRRTMPGIPELLRDDMEGDTHPELTPECFRQRTQVFESLLELINADDKQPATDLIDSVHGSDFDDL